MMWATTAIFFTISFTERGETEAGKFPWEKNGFFLSV